MRISRSNTPINQECSLFTVREEYPDHSLYYLNLDIRSRQNIAGVMTLLYEHLQENELFILMGFIYGLEKDFHRILPSLLSSVMILEHENKSGCQIQLICTDSNEVSVEEHGNARLSILNHYGSQLIFTSNILPDPSNKCSDQAYDAFRQLWTFLQSDGTVHNELARTWLYLDDILDWYDTLNNVRTDSFRKQGVYDNLIPASTGVGMKNAVNSCILMSAFSVATADKRNTIRLVNSPLQCPAVDYRSSFSRAVEINHPESKRLLVSGTASISASGDTLYYDDVPGQIKHTMEVVKAILSREDYDWNNIVRAIAYFRNPEDIAMFRKYCDSYGIDSNYIILTAGTICRDELLFEIELDAVKKL